ncbi:AAA family ATPase [Deinococcus sp.]|uniref:AAA family ATPase n=1 Tax=Deinococcus sp. TaxID=47478 RepID=UPI00286989B3|nr:AAA family ATPase [Deinococcus sp.]
MSGNTVGETPGIHALHGFLGSGKTTLARRLERELPGVRFSPDEWLVNLYGPDLDAETFPPAARRIHDQLEPLWMRIVSLGVPVILDSGFWSRDSRDTLRAQAAALGVPLTLYALEVPAAEARVRIARRNAEPGALPITGNAFDVLWARFEPLTADEDAVRDSHAHSF